MPKFHAAPPTRFGDRTAQPMPGPRSSKRGLPPPPTRFAPIAFQPKLGPAPRAAAAPPPTRFGPQASQLKAASHPYPIRGPAQTIQMSDSEDEDYPMVPPATPQVTDTEYWARGSDYWLENEDVSNAYLEKYEKHSGRTIGQTFGTEESDDYEESYVDIPLGARPAAPKALWNAVYAGLVAHPTKGNTLRVRCAELGDGYVEVDATTKCESGTNKRPPMCHIIAFNHIKWAVHWLFLNKGNKGNPYAQTYKGPDQDQLDMTTYGKLVWDVANLRPGHAACNSHTAAQARGVPSNPVGNAAVAYVGPKLKALQPGWF